MSSVPHWLNGASRDSNRDSREQGRGLTVNSILDRLSAAVGDRYRIDREIGAGGSGDRFSVTSRRDIGLEDAEVSTDAADYSVNPAGDEFVTSHLGTVKARLSVLLGGLPSR